MNSNMLSYGICDRCGNDIPKQVGEDLLVLKAANYKIDLQTYYLEFKLCSKCRQDFERWIFRKGGDSHGDQR